MTAQSRTFSAAKTATCLAALVAAGMAAPAQADTLRDALVAVYNTNPTLEGARA